jgi:hypothetical protein
MPATSNKLDSTLLERLTDARETFQRVRQSLKASLHQSLVLRERAHRTGRFLLGLHLQLAALEKRRAKHPRLRLFRGA